MNFRLLLLSIGVFSVLAPTGRADTADVTRAIKALSGQEASFTQRFLPRGYKKEQVEKGHVIFGDAPASRWSYDTPEAKTFVFDGTTSWMYVPADATVMVHVVSQNEKELLPFFVLSNPEKLDEWYEVEGTGSRLKLTARDTKALLRSIVLTFDDAGRLGALEYFDSQGNRTAFELGTWKKASSTPETLTFVPPPDVDVIEN